jgi:hypothetical protein
VDAMMKFFGKLEIGAGIYRDQGTHNRMKEAPGATQTHPASGETSLAVDGSVNFRRGKDGPPAAGPR